MILLTNDMEYEETIDIARKLLTDVYNNQVIFHCYWQGELTEKHLYSIISCYHFNKNHKIILWLENNISNEYNILIGKYAEIKLFNINDEIMNNDFMNNDFMNNDFIKYLLLYNFGGVWFDLNCFILRSFDPLFVHFQHHICVYRLEYSNIPNDAIYISLEPKSNNMKKNIEFIINRNNGFGFVKANMTFDLSLDLVILPCSWFNPISIKNPLGNEKDYKMFFRTTTERYDFNNFYNGSFCYNWNNLWNDEIENNSIAMQLYNIINKYENSENI